MTQTLPGVALEHHERLMTHVDRLPALGDRIGSASAAELRPQVDEVATFLAGLLVPHMEAAERTLYPELERMLQNRHSMTPMRREHDLIRAEVKKLEAIPMSMGDQPLPPRDAVKLRLSKTRES